MFSGLRPNSSILSVFGTHLAPDITDMSTCYWYESRLIYENSSCSLGLSANKAGTNRIFPDLGDFENYVYKINGGEGIYVYHVEQVNCSELCMKSKQLIR